MDTTAEASRPHGNDDGSDPRIAAWLDAVCAPLPPDALDAPRVSRTLLVLAHPDDETVGAGSRLAHLRTARFVYVTDGAPRDGRDAARHGLGVDAYREARRRERAAALQLCGVPPAHVIELGCPDQQAARRLPHLAMRLAELFTALQPEVVLTHPYEGGHPDHDATAFAVQAAAALVRRAGRPAPARIEMACYHQGPHGLAAAAFLPDPGAPQAPVTVRLDAAARARKQALLDCYATQRETLAQFPLDVERFRAAPRHDFLRPPHAGPLLYDLHPWGTDGAAFRAACRDALQALGLESAP